MQTSSKGFISGTGKRLVEFCIRAASIGVAVFEYRSLSKSVRVLKRIKELAKEIAGTPQIERMAKTGGKYYWNLHVPGFPSRIWIDYIRGEMNRVLPLRSKTNRLGILFLCVTKKCPLQCRHCYEWEALNGREVLSLRDLKGIALRFQESGVSHIHLGGGEPMLRFDDTVGLVQTIHKQSEVWMATSGWGLDREQALTLKKAGMTGVAISVDHFDPEKHNAFRGNPRSFDWAMKATKSSMEAGLAVCWSLCVTREFISRNNLFKYAEEAKKFGVHYIQLFEPIAAGRFKGMDVALRPDEIAILENFYREINTGKKFRNFPVAEYIAQYQRRIGCLGAGNYYAYVDTDGNIQACPFCRSAKTLSALEQPVPSLLAGIDRSSCKINMQPISGRFVVNSYGA